jgi:long-subunit acyl-CoA synthetase (AMP-forming)
MVPPWRIDGSISFRTALARGATMTLKPIELTREDIAFLQYTGGPPLPSTDVSIRDDRFNELPVWTGEGEIEKHTGEICVRGPQVMKGYWNNPGETAKTIQDGWLKTGDVGHLNADGHVTLTDRKKDVIFGLCIQRSQPGGGNDNHA